MWDVSDCSEMKQGEHEVYWGQPFLVKSTEDILTGYNVENEC